MTSEDTMKTRDFGIIATGDCAAVLSIMSPQAHIT
jgi:hypothetical protein